MLPATSAAYERKEDEDLLMSMLPSDASEATARIDDGFKQTAERKTPPDADRLSRRDDLHESQGGLLVAHRTSEENDRRIGAVMEEIDALKAQMHALQMADPSNMPIHEEEDDRDTNAEETRTPPAIDFGTDAYLRKLRDDLECGANAEPPQSVEFDNSHQDGVATAPVCVPVPRLLKYGTEAFASSTEERRDGSFAEYDDELPADGPALFSSSRAAATSSARKEPEGGMSTRSLSVGSKEEASWENCDRILRSMRDVLIAFERAVGRDEAAAREGGGRGGDLLMVDLPEQRRPRTPPRDPYIDAYMKYLINRSAPT
jgi:hypothetical protein